MKAVIPYSPMTSQCKSNQFCNAESSDYAFQVQYTKSNPEAFHYLLGLDQYPLNYSQASLNCRQDALYYRPCTPVFRCVGARTQNFDTCTKNIAEYQKQKSLQHEKQPSEHVPLCSVTDVQLRFLCPDDLEEVRTLCQDWFPIDYPLSWYADITSSSRFFALAAVYNLVIIGLIVAEIKPYNKLNKEDKGILPESMGKNADVGYILSLGVHRKHRRNGIGSLLLESLVNHLTTTERHSVKAIFLHVLTTNQPAILFYEKRRFHLHSFLPYYYNIRGKDKDGFTYVTYINGGHPPWTLDHLKHWGSKIAEAGGICSWIGKRIGQVFRWLWHRTASFFKIETQFRRRQLPSPTTAREIRSVIRDGHNSSGDGNAQLSSRIN